MKCPVDKIDMMVVEHRRIELDYCLRCSGVWFDAQELELLITSLAGNKNETAQNNLLAPTSAKVDEAPRKCPICRSKMDKVWLGKEPKILIDSCPHGDGLWFDGGELQRILKQFKGSDKQNVITFLGETFKEGQATDSQG